MRIARFTTGDGAAFGVVEGDEQALTVRQIDGHPFAPFQVVGDPLPLAEVRLLAPVLPSKVVAIGRNYAEHAQEMGGEVDLSEPPVVFLKPSTSVVGPGDAIQYPVGVSEEVHYEGELAVVIGRLCREVPAERVKRRGAGLHLRERRHRPRPAAPRVAVGTGQGLRHVLPARALGGPATSTPPTWRSPRPSTVSCGRPAARRRCCAPSTSWCRTSARR